MEDVIIAAANDGRFDVALFVYNFLQKDQGEKILKACKESDIGVTLMKMNPVNFYLGVSEMYNNAIKNGREIPETITKMMKDYEKWVAQAEEFKNKHGLQSNEQVRDTAIKFVLSHPEVHSACPSINNFEDLDMFVSLSGQKLQSEEISMLSDYEKMMGNYYCRHACGICEASCPHNVPVNTIMRYNHYFEAHKREKHALLKYEKLNDSKPDLCGSCSGPCVSACPYNVPIQSLLLMAHQNLTLE